MSRNRISRVTAVLFAATLISTVPLAFGATAQDIEHLRNGSFAQFQREASQRADEQARQNREQMRQFAEQNRQQMKDMEAQMHRDQQAREEADNKARLAAREKQLEEEAMQAKVPASSTEIPDDDATVH